MFPTVSSLAKAPVSDVLKAWQGLGYNRRALFLQRASQMITQEHKEKVPTTMEELVHLPGIGPNTAGAIMAFAFNKPVVFIETNIRRAFIYHFFPKKKMVGDKKVLKLLSETVPVNSSREWYYALMDYGAMLGKKVSNPNRQSAHYTKQLPFMGSRRQIRGLVLRMLLKQPYAEDVIIQESGRDREVVVSVLGLLKKEGFIVFRSGRWHIVTSKD